MGGQSTAHGCWAHATAGLDGDQELQFSPLHLGFGGFARRGSPQTDKGSNAVLLHFREILGHFHLLMKPSRSPADRISNLTEPSYLTMGGEQR